MNEKYARISEPGAVSLIPESKQFDQCYRINRVKLDKIYVSEDARNMVLKALEAGKMFVQIGKYTIMLNTICSIEPLTLRDKEQWEREEKRRKVFAEMKQSFDTN